MKTYCFNCCQPHEYSRTRMSEEETINGVTFSALQWHCYCQNCGKEVFPDQETDENTDIAHDAYRKAMGIITIEEMQKILESYNIGARPLSLLLGWGENTIERQMKHSIPDMEHSDRLKTLLDPANMTSLLIQNKENISESAFRKATDAAFVASRKIISESTIRKDKTVIAYNDPEKWNDSTMQISTDQNKQGKPGFCVSYKMSPQSNMFKTLPFDYPDAA